MGRPPGRLTPIGDRGCHGRARRGSSAPRMGRRDPGPRRRHRLGRGRSRSAPGRVQNEHTFAHCTPHVLRSPALSCSNPACGALFAVYATTDIHGVAVCRYCGASVIEVAGYDSGISTDDEADAVQVYVRQGPRSSEQSARHGADRRTREAWARVISPQARANITQAHAENSRILLAKEQASVRPTRRSR